MGGNNHGMVLKLRCESLRNSETTRCTLCTLNTTIYIYIYTTVYIFLALQILTGCLGTQKPPQNHLQKGLEHKGI